MAKYLVAFVLVLLGLGAFLGVWFSKDSYKILPVTETPVPEAALEKYNFQDWHAFSSPDQTFQVMFPTLPQHAKETVKDKKNGDERKYEMYVSEKEDGTMFMISTITFKKLKNDPVEDQKLLSEMMNDMVASNPKNVLQKSKEGDYKGHRTLEYTINNNELSIEVKSFLVKDRMYVMSRIAKLSNYNAEEYNFFINSFDLTAK